MRRSIAAAFCALFFSATASAWAGDGIKATAVAVRAVPADIVQVSFTLKETLAGEGAAAALETAARDGAAAIAGELAKRGLKVVRRTYAVLGKGYNTRYDSGGLSLFGRDTTASKAALTVQRTHTFHITGFKHPDEAIIQLTQLGVATSAPWHLQSSQADRVAEELALEASALAVAKARRLATHLGVTAGALVDVSTGDGRTAGAGGSYSGNAQHATEIGPDGLPRVVLVVSATVTLGRGAPGQ